VGRTELHDAGNVKIEAFNALVVITERVKKSHVFPDRNNRKGKEAFPVDMCYTFVYGTNGRCTMWNADYYGAPEADGWFGKVRVLTLLLLLFLSSTIHAYFSVFT
jgi:hypothetical protein